jgi:hypothetical protein
VDWVQDHQRRLQAAYELVKTKLQQAAAKRQKYANRNAKDHPLFIGQRVLVKRHDFVGRHKIQDVYHNDIFKVVQAKDGQATYCVEPSQGFGPHKWIHRSELRPCEDMRIKDCCGVVQLSRDPVPDSVSKGDEEDLPFECQGFAGTDLGNEVQPMENDIGNQHPPLEEEHLQDEPERVAPDGIALHLRRTTRVGAGKHSNLFHQPRSVFDK